MAELTPFDYGFELAEDPKLKPNDYNVDGARCPACPISETCLLARKKYPHLCFEGLQKVLTQTDVCRKVLDEEPISSQDAALHLYVDSMLYHLDHLKDGVNKPLDLWELWDIRSDCALDETKGGGMGPKHAVVCRFLGRQAIDILRERGYEI